MGVRILQGLARKQHWSRRRFFHDMKRTAGLGLLVACLLLFESKAARGDYVGEKEQGEHEGGEVEGSGAARWPFVINTWPFRDATRTAWDVVVAGRRPHASAVDAVVAGCSRCEDMGCDGSVGAYGSPDENGETTLDALVMDGDTMDVGAVGALRGVKGAIAAAALVLRHSELTLLVGDQASAFALSLGLPGPSNLSSPATLSQIATWRSHGCQPNYWRHVTPDSGKSCGPYRPSSSEEGQEQEQQRKAEEPPGTRDEAGEEDERDRSAEQASMGERRSKLRGALEEGGKEESSLGQIFSRNGPHVGRDNHDTISMVVIDKNGHIACGTSTNGLTYKIPGRVGDGPIAGASSYADSDVGGCGATGDGDVMMRFLPCYQVVESLRRGLTPKEAAEDAISRIRSKYPHFVGALFAVNKLGEHAGASNGWIFQYTVKHKGLEDVQVFTVPPAVPFVSALK